MKIAILDDYQDAFRKQKAVAKLAGHEIVAFTDTEK
ncbi:MAG: D-2-hydroxyacid dehydrogenase family protein, partial [Deltaproteobacteria bacterium]|nr:D-2-hydroxyacid dehydrogenase family protein [Deltaproteobacteria bacterium]